MDSPFVASRLSTPDPARTLDSGLPTSRSSPDQSRPVRTSPDQSGLRNTLDLTPDSGLSRLRTPDRQGVYQSTPNSKTPSPRRPLCFYRSVFSATDDAARARRAAGPALSCSEARASTRRRADERAARRALNSGRRDDAAPPAPWSCGSGVRSPATAVDV